jgi:hypothetical protein
MGKKTKELSKKFVSSLEKTAKFLGKEPSEVTKVEFVANDSEDIPEWDIRSAGGYKALQDLFFPKKDDIQLKAGSAMIRSHRAKLDKEYGSKLFLKDEILTEVKELLKSHTFTLHKPNNTKPKEFKKERAIVAHVSDTHFGANIDGDEMGGVNTFNWEVAARRMAYFGQQIAQYKPEYRANTELVVAINGDIIAGVIHNQEFFVDLLTTQFVGTLDILTQFLSYLAQHFKSIRVVCSPGNHGRAQHKASKDRGTTHKWDSYETMIFEALKMVVEAKLPNVKMEVPKTPFAVANVLGHKFYITHGDTVFNVGYPGKSINIHSINNQINKLNSSELGEDGNFAAILVGHVHSPTFHLAESGTAIVVNGCLSGADPYAQSLGIFTSNPTQQLFEVTKEHAIGDIRFIQVAGADKVTSMDAIIKPFVKGY